MNDVDGNEVSDKKGLSNLVKTYFEDLFAASTEEVSYGELPIEQEISVEENNRSGGWVFVRRIYWSYYTDVS